MYTIVLALHVFVCALLIVAVLMQSSKSGDIGSALGGGTGSNEMFGPAAPSNVMNKITTALATCFLVLCMILALMSNDNAPDSILRDFTGQPPASGQE
jgi:preprotein translocase subunit SecG